MENTGPSISYVIPADKALKDTVSGQYSLIDVFDSVVLKGERPTVISFCLAGRLNDVKSGEHVMPVRIFDPEGEMFAEVTLKGKNDNEGEVQFVAQFPLLTFSAPGKYVFEVELDGTQLENPGNFYITARKSR